MRNYSGASNVRKSFRRKLKSEKHKPISLLGRRDTYKFLRGSSCPGESLRRETRTELIVKMMNEQFKIMEQYKSMIEESKNINKVLDEQNKNMKKKR